MMNPKAREASLSIQHSSFIISFLPTPYFRLLRSDPPGVIGKLPVADTDGERLAHLGLGLSILAIDIERPGVGVERQYVVAPPNLQARDSERLGRLVRVLGVVQNQLPVGVVGALDPRSRLTFEISVSRASLGRAPGPVE